MTGDKRQVIQKSEDFDKADTIADVYLKTFNYLRRIHLIYLLEFEVVMMALIEAEKQAVLGKRKSVANAFDVGKQ